MIYLKPVFDYDCFAYLPPSTSHCDMISVGSKDSQSTGLHKHHKYPDKKTEGGLLQVSRS